MLSPNYPVLCFPLPYRVAPVFVQVVSPSLGWSPLSSFLVIWSPTGDTRGPSVVTSLLYKYCGAIRIICITVIPPSLPPLPPLPPLSLPPLSLPPSPPLPSLPLPSSRLASSCVCVSYILQLQGRRFPYMCKAMYQEGGIEVGLHQGSALSHLLFIITMDVLTENIEKDPP